MIGTQVRSRTGTYAGLEGALLIRKSGANSRRVFWSGKVSVLPMGAVLA
jgi:hypothetical protein